MANMRGQGLFGAAVMGARDPDSEGGDVTKGYLKGVAANLPIAGAAHVAEVRAMQDAAKMAQAREQFAQRNASSMNTRSHGMPQNFRQFEQPQRTSLRSAMGQVARNPREFMMGAARSLPPVMAASAGIDGAIQGYRTPTEEYARRNSMEMPESTMGQVGLRGLGVLQDVGNAATLGWPKRNVWPK